MDTTYRELLRDVKASVLLEALSCKHAVRAGANANAAAATKTAETAETADDETPSEDTAELEGTTDHVEDADDLLRGTKRRRKRPLDGVDAVRLARISVEACRRERERTRSGEDDSGSDASLSKLARFTDAFALADYAPFLQYVPRLVNVLAEAVPVKGTPKLPLDLNLIASRCSGAFFAPRRFSAVQLAFSHPRARVLIFHTGRLVGTGTSGPIAARLAVSRAQAQLAQEAGIYLTIRKFQIINQVGASSLEGELDCNRFADAHSFDAHFDAASFVGLAWRPANEAICAEIYGTGRANLPGSTTMRTLLESWTRMLPELLRFSTASHVCELVPERLKSVHYAQEVDASDVSKRAMLKKQKTAAAAVEHAESAENAENGDDLETSILASLGLGF